MREYIEREAVHRLVRSLSRYAWSSPDKSKYRVTVDYDDVQFGIDEIPTADVVKVLHGKWLETQEPLGWRDVDCIECSVCHESWIMDEDSSIDDYECMWHYCPNCGAKMDGATDTNVGGKLKEGAEE